MVFVVSFAFSVLLVEPSTVNCKTDTNLAKEREKPANGSHTHTHTHTSKQHYYCRYSSCFW